MNACTLATDYETKDDAARATDELLCTKINADAAAYCDTLRGKCAAELRRRQVPGSTGR